MLILSKKIMAGEELCHSKQFIFQLVDKFAIWKVYQLAFIWTYFTNCSGVSIFDFEQVNAGWVLCFIFTKGMCIYYVSFLTEVSFVLHPHDSHRDIRNNLPVIPDIINIYYRYIPGQWNVLVDECSLKTSFTMMQLVTKW